MACGSGPGHVPDPGPRTCTGCGIPVRLRAEPSDRTGPQPALRDEGMTRGFVWLLDRTPRSPPPGTRPICRVARALVPAAGRSPESGQPRRPRSDDRPGQQLRHDPRSGVHRRLSGPRRQRPSGGEQLAGTDQPLRLQGRRRCAMFLHQRGPDRAGCEAAAGGTRGHVRGRLVTNAVLEAVLGSSTDPSRTATRLGLPPHCADAAGRNWFAPGMETAHPCPEVFAVSRVDVAMLAFSEPRTLFAIIVSGVERARPWVPS